MKAMVFAAGLGTRLKPLTDTLPKALVPVNGKPLIDITLERLGRAGVTEAVVNVHHFADKLAAHIAAHDYGFPVRISDERGALLDTGGGLRKAAALFAPGDDPIIIHNVDILSNADLPALHAACAERGDDIALLVSERQTQRYLLFDDDMLLRGWTNIATGEVRSPYPSLHTESLHRLAFSGIHCVSPRCLAETDAFPEKFPIMDFYLSLCARLNIRAVTQPGLRLLDVGKQDTLQKAEEFAQSL